MLLSTRPKNQPGDQTQRRGWRGALQRHYLGCRAFLEDYWCSKTLISRGTGDLFMKSNILETRKKLSSKRLRKVEDGDQCHVLIQLGCAEIIASKVRFCTLIVVRLKVACPFGPIAIAFCLKSEHHVNYCLRTMLVQECENPLFFFFFVRWKLAVEIYLVWVEVDCVTGNRTNARSNETTEAISTE